MTSLDDLKRLEKETQHLYENAHDDMSDYFKDVLELIFTHEFTHERLIQSHEQLQKKFEEAVEVIKIIDLNFKKITKCPDNSCDGCHEDAKIAAEYSSKFLRSLDKGD